MIALFGLTSLIINSPVIHAQDQPQNLGAWTTFTDPEGEFSLQYPSNWAAEPKRNISEQFDLKITTPTESGAAIVFIQFGTLPPEFANAYDKIKGESGASDEIYSEAFVRVLFPKLISVIRSTLDSFQLVEDINYDKYYVDEYPAGSAVFSFTLQGTDYLGLEIWSLIKDRSFNVKFTSDAATFDSILPTVDKIVESIKFNN